MSDSKLDIKTVSTIVGLIIISAGVTGTWAVMKSNIYDLKNTVEKQAQRIHDLELKSVMESTTLKNVREDVSEIKQDVKTLLDR